MLPLEKRKVNKKQTAWAGAALRRLSPWRRQADDTPRSPSKKVLRALPFLFLLAAGAAACRPIVSYINDKLQNAASAVMGKVEAATGLRVQYSHLSPAILWGINMRGLTLQDGQSGKTIVSVRRITLRYNLWHIITDAQIWRRQSSSSKMESEPSRTNGKNAFSTLIIDGVNIDIDDNDALIKNRFFAGNAAGIASKTAAAKKPLVEIVREESKKMNIAFSMRRVNLRYKGKIGSNHGEAEISLDRVSLRRTRDGNIRFAAEGDALGEIENSALSFFSALSSFGDGTRTRVPRTALSTSFKAEVTVKSEIDGSTAILRFRDLAMAASTAPVTLAVKAVNILTHYADGVITVETIQTPLPLAAKCVIDTNKKQVPPSEQDEKASPASKLNAGSAIALSASVKTANLPINRVLSLRNKNDPISDALNAVLSSAFTTDTEFTADWGKLEGGRSAFTAAYHSAGSFKLLDALTKSGDIDVQYSLMGNDNMVRFSQLSCLGKNCDVRGQAVCFFSPLQIKGNLDVRRLTLPKGINASGNFAFNTLGGRVSSPGLAIYSKAVTMGNGFLNDIDVKIMPRGNASNRSFDISAHAALAGGEVNVSGNASKEGMLASVEVQQCFLDGIAALMGPLAAGEYFDRAQTVSQRWQEAWSGQPSNTDIKGEGGLEAASIVGEDGKEAGTDSMQGKTIMDVLGSFMFAGEAYISIDKGGLSYNVPYALVANTQKDNEALYLSLDGNKNTINVSQLDIAYGGKGANITAHVEKDEMGGAFFTLEAIAAMGAEIETVETAVPYRFSGNIARSGGGHGGGDAFMGEAFAASGRYLLTVSDEYGSLLQASLSRKETEGSLSMSSFPLRAGKSILSLSTETGFAWTKDDGIAIKIGRFEIASEGGGRFGENIRPASGGRQTADIAPRFMLSGEITKYGAFFDKMSYSDSFSALDGSASAFLNMNAGVFDSAKLDFNLSSAVSGESIVFDSELTNPSGYPFTLSRMKEDFFFNISMQLKSFALSRFVSERSDNNTLTASLDATGTLSNPYISLDVPRVSVMFAGVPIVASGKTFVIDKALTVTGTKLRYGEVNITDVRADFSCETFTGVAQAALDVGLDKSLFSMPISFSIIDTDVSSKTHLPLSFTASIDSDGATGAFLKGPFPFNITIMRSEQETAIFSSDNLGISGYLVDGGEVNITSSSEFLGFNITGKNDWENLDFNINDLNINIASIASRFNNDKFAMYRGVLTGGVAVGGIRSDPDFVGELAIENADFSLLKVVPYHITGRSIPIVAEHSEMNIPETLLSDKGKGVFLSGKIILDRWRFDNMELFVRTPAGGTAPALLDVGIATFAGDASIDLTVGIDRNKTMEVTGDVYVENTKANVRAREVMNMSSAMHSEIFSRRIDVDITMGQHIFVTLDPLLRAVLTPQSKVNFKMDENTESFSLKGDVGIKSGDIAWFNRSFYLKDGFIRFNDNEDNFDPTITIRAETRDRDDDGKDVKIIMNASNQPLSRFSPKFSSVPVKSEAEIRAMLGQIAVGMPGESGTSASDVMLSMGDFAVAATVGRAVENTIRDIFNFDIFSIRTMALQNVFKSSINNDQTQNNNITAGNLLDNSTVYIGKYIGSVIYLDAMLRLSYDEHKEDDIGSKNGILFQPEVGFELDAPFAGIRWSMAPDLDAMKQNIFMPITSVTLSWGFSF